METRDLAIDGMSCGHCVSRVSKALAALPGVKVENVDVGSARISLDPARTSLQQVAETLDDLGFALRQ